MVLDFLSYSNIIHDFGDDIRSFMSRLGGARGRYTVQNQSVGARTSSFARGSHSMLPFPLTHSINVSQSSVLPNLPYQHFIARKQQIRQHVLQHRFSSSYDADGDSCCSEVKISFYVPETDVIDNPNSAGNLTVTFSPSDIGYCSSANDTSNKNGITFSPSAFRPCKSASILTRPSPPHRMSELPTLKTASTQISGSTGSPTTPPATPQLPTTRTSGTSRSTLRATCRLERTRQSTWRCSQAMDVKRQRARSALRQRTATAARPARKVNAMSHLAVWRAFRLKMLRR